MGTEHKKSTIDYSALGWGALIAWWGIVILVDPLTIGMGAIGTGLICFGVNAIRSLSGVQPVRGTTVFGAMSLIWGALDVMLHPSLEVGFAFMLIVVGVVMVLNDLLKGRRMDVGEAV